MARSGPLFLHAHTRRALATTFALAATLLIPSLERASVARAAPSLLRASLFRGCAPGDVVHRLTPTSVSIEPHRGFDPGTASDALLRCYGYPLPPRDAAGRARWVAEMRPLRYAVPVVTGVLPPDAGHAGPALSGLSHTGSAPSHQVAATNVREGARSALRNAGAPRSGPRALIETRGDSIWAGPIVVSGDNGGMRFAQADGDWTVPIVSYTPYEIQNNIYGDSESSWVGLGGDGHENASAKPNQVLWQAGVYSIVDPQRTHYPGPGTNPGQGTGYYYFYEDYGCGPPAPGYDGDPYTPTAPCPNGGNEVFFHCVQPALDGGDHIRAYVNGQQGTYFFANYTKNMALSVVSVPIDNSNTDLSAEFIEEDVGCTDRTSQNLQGAYDCSVYPSWPASTFLRAVVTDTAGNQHNVDGLNYRVVNVCNNNAYGQYVTTTSAIDPSTHQFTIAGTPQQPYGSCGT